jgi:hypothetical protein
LQRLTDFARSKPVVTKELGVNIVERIAHGALNDALAIDIHYRRQNLRYGQNGWFRSRIGLCKKRCGVCRIQQSDNKRADGASG